MYFYSRLITSILNILIFLDFKTLLQHFPRYELNISYRNRFFYIVFVEQHQRKGSFTAISRHIKVNIFRFLQTSFICYHGHVTYAQFNTETVRANICTSVPKNTVTIKWQYSSALVPSISVTVYGLLHTIQIQENWTTGEEKWSQEYLRMRRGLSNNISNIRYVHFCNRGTEYILKDSLSKEIFRISSTELLRVLIYSTIRYTAVNKLLGFVKQSEDDTLSIFEAEYWATDLTTASFREVNKTSNLKVLGTGYKHNNFVLRSEYETYAILEWIKKRP